MIQTVHTLGRVMRAPWDARPQALADLMVTDEGPTEFDAVAPWTDIGITRQYTVSPYRSAIVLQESDVPRVSANDLSGRTLAITHKHVSAMRFKTVVFPEIEIVDWEITFAIQANGYTVKFLTADESYEFETDLGR